MRYTAYMQNNKHTILLIEDDKTQIQILSEKIAGEGFNVLQAVDGVKGLETALSEKPDLILLDNRMPEMSGYEMLRRLRDGGGWGETVPVIFFSNIEPSGKDEQADLEMVAPIAYL